MQTEEVKAMVEVTKQLVTRLEKEERGRGQAAEPRLTLQDLRSELRSLATSMQRPAPLPLSCPIVFYR